MRWASWSAGGLIVLAALALGAEPGVQQASRVVRGRIVWLADALERLHGVRLVPEAREHILVLETPSGELVPLVEDERGRAFRSDGRLRGIDVEVVGRQQRGSPFLQVMKLFAVDDGRRYELDYWCEICSIAMFELKPCDCCQGSIELRRREVDDSGQPLR
jgi:hypothetical protein